MTARYGRHGDRRVPQSAAPTFGFLLGLVVFAVATLYLLFQIVRWAL